MKCPECGASMKGGSCPSCGYSAGKKPAAGKMPMGKKKKPAMGPKPMHKQMADNLMKAY